MGQLSTVAELALNCFHHAGFGMSPFKALYGREPPNLIFTQPSATTPPSAAEVIRERGVLLVELCHNLERASNECANLLTNIVAMLNLR